MFAAQDDAGPDEVHGAIEGSSWVREISSGGWWVLLSATLAWTFEVYDLAIISVLTPVLLKVFHLTKAEMGLVTSAAAFGSIIGGIAFGYIADRFGRVRTLYAAILIYSAFTGLILFSSGLTELLILRFLGGLGMGGAWAAGAALVAESLPPRHRGKGGAIMQSGLPLGQILAIALSAVVTQASGGLEGGAWRWLIGFGALPAIILLPIILRTPESPIWLAGRNTPRTGTKSTGRLFTRELLIAFIFIFFVQFVFWGVSSWTPTFLVTVKHMTFLKSLGFLLAQQIGTLLGFVALAALIDRIGRRYTFLLYLLIGAAALGVFIFADQPQLLLLATSLVGFGLGGIFGGLGPFLAELLSSSGNRAFGMALAYNGGRTGALIAPVLVGAMGNTEAGFQLGMSLTGVALVAAAITIVFAPETKGRVLS
ncbi:MFS transporter [Sphingomonas sp. PAMC26645]|uniref:MFS transporter n=1 Tax=Sphingomonas sp. PAMC26645 TaxID=2565555 RepID=UPI00109DB9B8|nr:MFS transporter [Sphingomonas sp. PAMC26645]QCB43270.1 MFS transporter [Sphingomonas sp. PAMC26645]